jgi:hypothetical protein
MAKIIKSTASQGVKSAAPMAVGDSTDAYLLQDNNDGSFDVFGLNAAGNRVDITGVATLDASSSDDSVVAVSPPTGAHVACQAKKPGSAEIKATATWNDGSVGPFEITVPCDVKSSPVKGLVAEFGDPTIRG